MVSVIFWSLSILLSWHVETRSVTAFIISENSNSRRIFGITTRESLSSQLQKQSYSVHSNAVSPLCKDKRIISTSRSSSTARSMVWWYGGSENADETANEDSCELVAVRIERTSANSRRIFGEIYLPNVSMDNVWSILTDYDNLSVHVPNLVESRVVQKGVNGRPGDGQYKCRLYQKGAQKIIGFEFGASVTMDMKESFIQSPIDGDTQKITFKCQDSFFFQEFDGEWKAIERTNPTTGEMETVLSYVVDVRPKGPVPVAALEWRIREDVPTNLRAVKKAATLRQEQQAKLLVANNNNYNRNNVDNNDIVQAYSNSNGKQQTKKTTLTLTKRNGISASDAGVATANSTNKAVRGKASPTLARDTRLKVQWYKDETMAAYLSD